MRTLNTSENFWGSSVGLGNSLIMVLSLVFVREVKDTWGGSPAALDGWFILKGDCPGWKGSLDRELESMSAQVKVDRGERWELRVLLSFRYLLHLFKFLISLLQ